MRQGEVYWLRFAGQGSKPEGRSPALVVQHDRFNRSAIQTTVVVAITSNLRLARGCISRPRPEPHASLENRRREVGKSTPIANQVTRPKARAGTSASP